MKEIRLSGITKRFGETVAVSELNLEVERGEFVTLLGPSGCGKTTTLRLLAGFQPPSAGFIEIGGRVVSDVERNIFVPPAKRRIGMVFQDYALWPHMDVFANTVYPLKIAGVNRKERQDRVDQILTIVKMSGMQKRFPHELSGGQQQRVALARALISDPAVLLLDEPLSNLDAALRDDMRLEIKSLHQRLGVTVVFVTHDQSEAMSMSDRIVVIDLGRIQQVGTPESLYDDPQNRFVASFIGRANFFKVSVRENKLMIDTGERLVPLDAERVTGSLREGLGCAKPADIRLSQSEAAGIPCRISNFLFVGDHVVYHVEINGLKLEVKTTDRSFASLTEATVCFEKVVLF
jgi:iron(III) transport system ATP-binding protein